MARLFLSAFLFIVAVASATAQSPQYTFSSYHYGDLPGYYGLTGGDKAIQSIYYHTDFPGLKTGAISNVYLRIGSTFSPASDLTINDVVIKIGYTSATEYMGSFPWTPISGLTTVFTAATITIPAGEDTLGHWFKFPVTTGSFLYDSTKNFVVEISWGYPDVSSMLPIMISNNSAVYRSISNSRGSNIGGAVKSTMDLGFDLSTTAVGNEIKLTDLKFVPNPTTSDCFLEITSDQELKNVLMTITDITGKILASDIYHPNARQFARKVNLGNLGAGMYFLKIEADGGKITRQILKQ